MKTCVECDYCLEKWIGNLFQGYVCRKTYENIINEKEPPCQKESNNE